MFNPSEMIDELVFLGHDREEAIKMARAEMTRRKKLSFKTGTVSENDYANRKGPKQPLVLDWGHRK